MACGAPRVLVFGLLVQHFLRAVQARQRLGDLRADPHHLEHGRHQERQVRGESHESAQGQRSGEDLARAQVHHGGAHQPHQHGGGKAHQRDGGQAAQHIVEQALDAAREDARLLGLGVISLHHAHAGQRLGEPAGDLGVDLAALAEDRPDAPERLAQPQRERRDKQQGQPREQRADAQQQDQCNQRGQNPAYELDQARADEIADALHVGHDAGNQHPGLVGVVVRHRQAAHVFLDLAPQFRDQALRLFRKQLREDEGGDTLNDGGREHQQDQRLQHPGLVLHDDVIHQELGGTRQNQAGGPVDQHQQEAQRELPAARAHQLLQ